MKNMLRNIIKDKKNFIVLILILTAMSAFVYREFLTLSKLYIYKDSGGDTLISYWPYYQNLVSLVKSGQFSFWNFQNGAGNNIFSRPGDLVDPFNIVFYFISTKYIAYALGWIAFVKVILAGIFFYLYLSRFRFSKTSCAAVSILYAFNGYIILWGQHYGFATVMVFFPLFLSFYEKWFKEKKWMPFMLLTTLISSYSFYFFYIISIYLFIYALFRYLLDREFKIKEFFSYFMKTIIIYILGIALGAAIILPSIAVLTSNPRVDVAQNSLSVFKPDILINYIATVERFFTNNIIIQGQLHYDGWWNYYESPILYCGIITLLLIPQIFVVSSKKEKIIYLLWLVLFGVFLIFPFFSYMMNAFSVPYHRWTFVIILFELYVLAVVVDKLEANYRLNAKVLIATFVCLCIIPLLALYIGKHNIAWRADQIQASLKEIKIVIVYLFLYTMCLLAGKIESIRKYSKFMILLVLCVELASFANANVNDRELLDSSYLTNNKGYFDSTNDAVSCLKEIDNGVYRTDKGFMSVSYSEAYMQGFYGIKGYDSSNNPQYTDFIRKLDINPAEKYLPNFIGAFGERVKLQTLLGVKYYITTSKDDKIPHDFVFLKAVKDLKIYENNSFLPLGFTYDSYMTCEDFVKLDNNQKDDALLSGFIINNDKIQGFNKLSTAQFDNSIRTLEISSENVTGKNIGSVVNELPASYRYTALNADPNIIIPLKNTDKKITDLTVNMEVDSDKQGTVQVFWKNNNEGYSEENSKTVDLKQGKNNLKLSISGKDINVLRFDVGSAAGNYEIKNLKINDSSFQNFDQYENMTDKLKAEPLIIDHMGKSTIDGTINLTSKKLLCLTVPYDKGWSAFVDGKKTDINKVDVGFMGIFMDKGIHHVEFKYTPPLLVPGIFVSFGALIVILFIYKFKMIR